MVWLSLPSTYHGLSLYDDAGETLGAHNVTRVKRDTIAYLTIIVFCIVMLIWAIPKYTPAYPGYGASPALVPNVAVGIILAMSILALIRNALAAFMNKPLLPEEANFPEDGTEGGFTQIGRINLIHLISFVIPCVLLIIGIEYIGYLAAAFLFLLLIQYIIGNRRFVQPVLVSVITVGLMYVAMRYGFGVPIPGPQFF